MTPTERHMYAVKEMERVVHEFELFAESSCSAQELTGVIVQHVLKLTDIKRKVCCCLLVAWRRGVVVVSLVSINEVNLHLSLIHI